MTLAGAQRHDVPELSDREMEAALRHYEALISTMAQRLVKSGVEEKIEDVQQVLRIRAWKAIRAYDHAKARGMTRDGYLFMVLKDGVKDIGKKKRRGDLYIEDIAPSVQGERDDLGGSSVTDRFFEHYLSTDHDEVYGDVDEGDLLLPNTLSLREHAVLDLMRQHYRQTEIAIELRIPKREVESAVRSIRVKFADWRPSAHANNSVPAAA